MTKIFELLFFITAFILYGMGQVLLWELPKDDRLVPYLLSAIFCILVVIYLQKGNNQ